MLLLYLASTLYHAWPQTNGKCSPGDRSFGHFLLIARTYSPFTLGPLAAVWATTIFGVISALAILDVLMKRYRVALPVTGNSRLHYISEWDGWRLVVVRPLAAVVLASTLVWLFVGGFAYTVGVIFYLTNAVATAISGHLFVLAGTGCHFLAVLACAR